MLGHLLSWALLPFFLSPFAAIHPPDTHVWSVRTASTGTTTQVVVTYGTPASSTTITLNAPYGVKSELVSTDGVTYATTSPITEADIKKMQQEQTAFEERMRRILEDQRELFNDMWSGFPF